MTFDESFVTASASIIFIALTFKYCKSAINEAIEKRVENISAKFSEVLQIKDASEILLKEQQALYASSEEKIKEILLSAEDEISQLRIKAELDVNLQLQNKTNNIQQKIHNQEQKALTELRLKALTMAISGSISLLKSHGTNNSLSKLNMEAIDIMSHHFN